MLMVTSSPELQGHRNLIFFLKILTPQIDTLISIVILHVTSQIIVADILVYFDCSNPYQLLVMY